MAESTTEKTASARKPDRFDGNDLNFYIGLLLLGTGLGLTISWPVALAVIGGVLVLVGVASAFLLVWLSGHR